jgi:hypothetical protein
VLALGAAAAGYAALSKSGPAPHILTATVAQAAPPTATSTQPASSGLTPPKQLGSSTQGLGTPTTIKPPKIPLTASVPKGATTTPNTSSGLPGAAPGQPTTSTPSTPTNGAPNAASPQENLPAAILLDTNAASTYNPYNYPATDFGDPSLTIDGDPTTGWTAVVDPTTAPKMAVGVLIDLKAKQRVASLKLITTTPGIRVQVYGSESATAPPSITDPAWLTLSRLEPVKKKQLRIRLRDSTKAFTFITLWISRAPASAVGTPEAPGHVSINEIELFPAA